MTQTGTFRVVNESPVISAPVLALLGLRLERGGSGQPGSGLGLAIVAAKADRIASAQVL